MLPPRTQLEAALQPSFDDLRPLHHEEDNALYGPAVTAFSMLDGALVRHGLKSDTDIRNELRDKLKDLSLSRMQNQQSMLSRISLSAYP